MEAFKVVHNRLKDCRTMYKRREPSGKNQQVLMTAKIEEPNKNCAVCSQAGATQYLRINTKATTLATFLARVLKGELGFNEPLLDTGDNTLEFLASFDDPQEARQLEAKLGLPLSDPAVGITHQASVAVQDESQGDCKVSGGLAAAPAAGPRPWRGAMPRDATTESNLQEPSLDEVARTELKTCSARRALGA